MIGFACLENTLGWRGLAMQADFAAGGGGAAGTPGGQSLNDLLEGVDTIACKGDLKVQVVCLVTDSRRVVPGALFFALRGLNTDGNLYIEEAIDRGAAAIVSETPQASMRQLPWIQVADIRTSLAAISRRFHRYPDQSIDLIGVTGTNGKTTVTTLVHYLLSENPADTGLIGTVKYHLGRRTLPSYKTTPESVDICSMLDQMRAEGCARAVMEVSSHALDQKRVAGLKIRVAAFLNLTRDHLDYHGDMDTYFAVKKRLFTGEIGPLPEVAVINLDDPYGRKLAESLPKSVKCIGFGMTTAADVRADQVKLDPCGSKFQVYWPGGSAAVETREAGSYNVSNILAALAICLACGQDPAQRVGRIPEFGGVPGRMQRVEAGQPFNVLVDYAHTGDALRNALGMLREVTPGKLLVVFGCGGNRDRGKRPLMTSVAQELADFCWATSDNPRKEPLADIFADMRTGVTHPDRIDFIENRREAIAMALRQARDGDCVLIAGKGHESYQEFADTIIPFDDHQTALELLQRPDGNTSQ